MNFTPLQGSKILRIGLKVRKISDSKFRNWCWIRWKPLSWSHSAEHADGSRQSSNSQGFVADWKKSSVMFTNIEIIIFVSSRLKIFDLWRPLFLPISCCFFINWECNTNWLENYSASFNGVISQHHRKGAYIRMSSLSTIEKISIYNGTATNLEAEKSSIHLQHLEIFCVAS